MNAAIQLPRAAHIARLDAPGDDGLDDDGWQGEIIAYSFSQFQFQPRGSRASTYPTVSRGTTQPRFPFVLPRALRRRYGPDPA